MSPSAATNVRRRVSLALSLSLVATLGTMSLAPLARAATPVPTYYLTASAPVKGAPKPYLLNLAVAQHGHETSIVISLTRTSPLNNHPSQSHIFSFLPRDALSCQSDLDVCTVDTGDQMGKWGRLKMKFTRNAPRYVTVRKCKDGSKASTTTRARGLLGGLFKLATFTTFFKTITNGSTQVHIPNKIAAVAMKRVVYKTCAGGGGSPTCREALTISGFRQIPPSYNGYMSEYGYRRIPSTKARVSFSWQQDLGSTTPANVLHVITALVPKSAVTATPNLGAGKVDIGSLAPMGRDEATFTASAPATLFGTTCQTRSRQGVLTGGRGVFDGWGTKSFGTSSNALITKVVKVQEP